MFLVAIFSSPFSHQPSAKDFLSHTSTKSLSPRSLMTFSDPVDSSSPCRRQSPTLFPKFYSTLAAVRPVVLRWYPFSLSDSSHSHSFFFQVPLSSLKCCYPSTFCRSLSLRTLPALLALARLSSTQAPEPPSCGRFLSSGVLKLWCPSRSFSWALTLTPLSHRHLRPCSKEDFPLPLKLVLSPLFLLSGKDITTLSVVIQVKQKCSSLTSHFLYPINHQIPIQTSWTHALLLSIYILFCIPSENICTKSAYLKTVLCFTFYPPVTS